MKESLRIILLLAVACSAVCSSRHCGAVGKGHLCRRLLLVHGAAF